MPTTVAQAYEIASRDLRACYNPEGIVAGRDHFNAYWSRDGFWGVFGALELGDYKQAKNHLTFMAQHQLANGQLPNQIRYTASGLFHFNDYRTTPKSIFRVAQFYSIPLDSPALYIMAVWQYFRHTLDQQFLREQFRPITRALDWLKSKDRDRDGLIESTKMSDWMDSVLKKGKVANINMIWAKALANYIDICQHLGEKKKEQQTQKLLEQTLVKINQVFWNGEYFVDYVDGNEIGGFCSDANIMALLFEFISQAQGESIHDYIKSHRLDFATPLHTVHPVYDSSQIYWLYRLAGLGDYHGKLIWLWLGSLWSLVEWRLGHRLEARAEMAKIAQWILQNGEVAEVYTREGKPVNRMFYRAEAPFAWNAAAFIYAARSMGLAGGPHHVRHH